MNRRVLFSFLTFALLILGTAIVVSYGKGYRLSFSQDRTKILGTGLLVATSNPDGAQVFVNGRLTSATNTTLNLVPGEYNVKIVKVGYLPWQKKLRIDKEVVTKTDATLFPIAPGLNSLSSTGVFEPILDPTQTRIAYKIRDLAPERNGIYLFEMAGRPILTQNTASKLVDDTKNAFSTAQINFSPSGKNLIATTSATFLLNTDGQNNNPKQISETELSGLVAQWEKEADEEEKSRLSNLKPELQKIILSAFGDDRKWSPDETKIMYLASTSATLAQFITPPLAGSNTQAETRQIEKGKVYVYDIKEDKNFLQDSDFSKIIWLPDGRHLIVMASDSISIMEYDGTNRNTIYAGPFSGEFVAPWPDGSKLVILTNLGNLKVTPNLYTINLK